MALTEDQLDLGLPRAQAGTSPQHLIVSLLGEYWLDRDDRVPSAALVQLAGDFGVSATSARAALSRLARRGLLDSHKDGRNTFYGLTAQAGKALREDQARIMSLGVGELPWDGSWVVVMFSLPEDRRDVRHLLRSALRWRGFAPLFDGVWVSPRADAAETSDVLAELGIDNSTILQSEVLRAVGGGDPLAAWDLDELAGSYREFIGRFASVLDRIESGSVPVAEALVLRGQVLEAWSAFPDADPGLPDDALPADWPRRLARDTFIMAYDGLGPMAALRFGQVLEQYSVASDAPPSFTTAEQWLSGRSATQ